MTDDEWGAEGFEDADDGLEDGGTEDYEGEGYDPAFAHGWLAAMSGAAEEEDDAEDFEEAEDHEVGASYADQIEAEEVDRQLDYLESSHAMLQHADVQHAVIADAREIAERLGADWRDMPRIVEFVAREQGWIGDPDRAPADVAGDRIVNAGPRRFRLGS
jgi:hypothetical protein